MSPRFATLLVALVQPVACGGDEVGTTWPFSGTGPGHSFGPIGDGGKRIDFILVDKSLSATMSGLVPAVAVSDHWPVVTTVLLP